MRERVVPENPKSAAQQNVRGAFGGASKGFKNMPNVDALAWDEFGKTQRSKTGKPLSGIGAWNRLAIVYRLVNPGGTPPLTPPEADYLGGGFAVSAASDTGSIVFSGSPTPAGTVVEVLLQKLPSANRKPTYTGYKTVAYTVFSVTNHNKYVAEVGPGTYAAAYRFVDTATGQQTELVQLNVLGVTLQVVRGGADEAAKSAA